MSLDDGALVFWNEEGEMKLFKVLQFHVHSPSEHTIDGQYFDLELHIVHQDYDLEKLAVVGIFFDVEEGGNEENPFISALQADRNNTIVADLPLADLLRKIDRE